MKHCLPQVAHVDGALSEVLETSCGKSIIAVDTTVYELSGVDLVAREFAVLDMSASDCITKSTPSSADCYRFVP